MTTASGVNPCIEVGKSGVRRSQGYSYCQMDITSLATSWP